MTATEVALAFAQITFPIFVAAGVAVPIISPTTTRRMAPMIVALFGIAIADLWVAIIVGGSVLFSQASLLDDLVAITMFVSGGLITYVLAVPLVIWLFELVIYRRGIRS